MKNLIFLILSSIFFLNCSKESTDLNPVVKDPVKLFEITNIKKSQDDVVIGHTISLTAVLTDSTGNINYEWSLFYNGQQVGQSKSGIGIKAVTTFPTSIGSYTVRLKITRGSFDSFSLETKFNSLESDFQFGVWGDTETTIKEAESNMGNSINGSLVGIPYVEPNNAGLTTVTYNKSGDFYTYYFKSGKLYAGAYTKGWSVQTGTVALTPYLYFLQEKTNLENKIKAPLPEGKVWSGMATDASQKAYYDQSNNNRALALGWGYLEFITSATSSVGRCSLHLYNYKSVSKVYLEYILMAP